MSLMDHPGVTLSATMARYGVSASALASAMGVSVTRIAEIVRGNRGITPDTALRLARYFGDRTADTWMDLQADYELMKATHEDGARIYQEVIPMARQVPLPGYERIVTE